MPTLRRFTNQDLPDAYAHQIRDFVRIHWFDIFQYDLHAPVLADEWQPVYFVVAEEQALFSHAAVEIHTIECNGLSYSCAGVSNVLTYPAFRKRGYGNQVIQAAMEYLRSQPVDATLLWTDPDKEGFYRRYGWEHHPSIQTYSGDRNAPEHYNAFTMIGLLSERAKQNRADFEQHPVYIGQYAW
jgi:predicted acetyltransferase